MSRSSHPKLSKRRLFIGTPECAHCVFSFNQHSDGSIYVSSPKFEDIVWYAIDDEIGMVSERFPSNSKLSVHGTGLSHVSSPGRNSEFGYSGAFLRRDTAKTMGVRHLLTTYPTLPLAETSPPGSRATDLFLKKDPVLPGVFVFFAVPALGARIAVENFQVPAEFQSDYPQHQWGYFQLLSHFVVWYFYRTKFMEEWPAETHACALDGIHVPLMVGVGKSRQQINIKTPRVTLIENVLTIDLG